MRLTTQYRFFFVVAPVIIIPITLAIFAMMPVLDSYGRLQTGVVVGSLTIFFLLFYLIIIGERRRSRQSEQKYRELVESANCVIIRMALDGKVTFLNFFAQKILKCTEKEVIGRHILESVLAASKSNGEDQAAAIAAICREPDKFPLTELEFISRNSQPVLLSLSVKATTYKGNKINDILLIGQDISERRHIQNLLITSEKMVMVGGLAAGMAHELNNPLGIIMQNVQNIQRRFSGSLPANQCVAESAGIDLERLHQYLNDRGINRMLEDTFNAGLRAADIIAGLLKFSRMGGNKHEAVMLSDLVESTISLASCDYELKKTYNFMSISIIRDYDDQIPATRVCRQEIEQMLFNLLKNAAQAIACNPQERPPQIKIKISFDNSWVKIELSDNGTGMSDETCKRVFEPFFTTRGVGAGTGLGLSISYAIAVNNHHGSIAVSSSPGEGSLFTVRLPIIPGAV